MTQNKQYIELHKNLGRMRAVPHLYGCHPGICLTTEVKARKNLSQVSQNLSQGSIWNTCHYTKFDWSFLVGVTFDSKKIKVVLGPNDTRYRGGCRGTHRHGEENTCTISFHSLVLLANEANNHISIS
jgi:hypothetical protein